MTRATKPAKPPSKATSKPKSRPPASPEPKEPSLAEDLATQPAEVVLALLRKESVALNAGAIKSRLMESGVDKAIVESAWNRARDKIRFDDHVIVEKNTYRFTATARVISPKEAVDRLARGGEPAKRSELFAIIQTALEGVTKTPSELAEARHKIAAAEQRIGTLEQEIATLSAEMAAERQAEKAALEAAMEAAKRTAEQASAAAAKAGEQAAVAAPSPVDDTAHAQYERAERRRAARERQARIDAMAAVAELAAEVEELTAKRAPSDVLLEHTRALTGGSGLEAIGRAGEATPYNESHHDPVGDFPNEGDSVIVIRPGYLWHAPGEAVLISKALVTRA
ncbi:MAG: hypothetical protein QOE61_4802 [Micromonosporaceae bacterium]|nr:hypothetical protein [Micromonosporaceae bacterium]